MVKNEKFQCPSERGAPEDFKNHPTFVSSAIFWGAMASQNGNIFFGTPCTILGLKDSPQTLFSKSLDSTASPL